MRIDRKEFIEELVLREHISRAIRIVQDKRRKQKLSSLKEERELRALVRQLLVEADADKAPHKSTGINVLEDLLKKIVPVVEQDYKQLTTDPNQRESFRAHIINAVQNTIAPVAASEEGDAEKAAPGDNYEVMGLNPRKVTLRVPKMHLLISTVVQEKKAMHSDLLVKTRLVGTLLNLHSIKLKNKSLMLTLC